MESGVSMINRINLGSAKQQPPEKRGQGAARTTLHGQPPDQQAKPPLPNSSSTVFLALISSNTIGSGHSSSSAAFLALTSSNSIGHGN